MCTYLMNYWVAASQSLWQHKILNQNGLGWLGFSQEYSQTQDNVFCLVTFREENRFLLYASLHVSTWQNWQEKLAGETGTSMFYFSLCLAEKWKISNVLCWVNRQQPLRLQKIGPNIQFQLIKIKEHLFNIT